jgi:hypothetical protein
LFTRQRIRLELFSQKASRRAAKHFSLFISKTNKLFSHFQDAAVRRKLLHHVMTILNHIFRAKCRVNKIREK